MLQLPSVSFLWQAFFQTLRRFPGVYLCAFVAVYALLSIIEMESSRYDDWPRASINRHIALWMVAQLGLPVMIGLHAMRTQRRWPWWYEATGGAVAAVLLIFYYFNLEPGAPAFDQLPLPRYLALWCVAHLFVSVAPYVNRLAVADFWEYNKDLFSHFIVGGIYTLILFAGLSGALLAVDKLFDLHVKGQVYPQMFVLLVGFFHVTYFLYHFPAEYENARLAEQGYHSILKNLCKFILIPLTFLYFLILYAYGLKILLAFKLPDGWVSSLVLGFSVVGVLTWLLVYRLPSYDDSGLVRIFHRWFWPVLFPLLVLLFVAIGRRLSDYGVTEERYLVAHTGGWLLLCAIWYIISRRDNIKFIPLSLAAFTLVAAFGPFSMFRVSDRSQESNLRELLTAHGRFTDGRAQPGSEELTGEPAQRIESVLAYFERRGRLPQLQAWFPQNLDSLQTKRDLADVVKWLRVSPATSLPDNAYLSLIPYYPMRQEVISGKNFDHILDLSLSKESESDQDSTYRHCRLSADGLSLLIAARPPLQADTLSMLPVIQYYTEMQATNRQIVLNADHNKVSLRGRHYQGQLVVRTMQFPKEKDMWYVQHVEGMLLLRRE